MLRDVPSQSLGALTLIYVLLTVSALTFRAASSSFTRYYQQIERQLLSTTAEGEPRSDMEHPAIFAAVLAPVNDSLHKWSADSLSPPDGERIELFLKSFTAMAKFGLDLRIAGRDRVGSTKGLMHALEQYAKRPLSDSLERRIERHLQVFLDRPADFLDAISPQRSSSITERAANQGLVGTQHVDEDTLQTSLLVPSTFHVDTTQGRPSYGDPGVLEAATLSLVLEDALDVVKETHGLPESKLGKSSIVQAYCISDRSVLRIWPKPPSVLSLPPTRYWAAAHYVQRFYEKRHETDTSYVTPPYIDVGSHGIVRTAVRIVPRDRDQVSKHLFGVVAIDYRLPLEPYLNSLASQNVFFRIHQLRVPNKTNLAHVKADDPRHRLLVSHPPYGRDVPVRSLWKKSSSTERLLGRVRDYGAATTAEDQRRMLGVEPNQGPENDSPKQVFVLPLAIDEKGEDIYLLLSPQTPKLPFDTYLYAIVGVAALLAASGLLLYWRHQADKQREKLREATFKRNLPIGLVEVNESDVVVSANQAAEWLFATTLHQHEEERDELFQGRKFKELIEDLVIPRVDETSVLATPVSYEDILEKRRRGAASTYYAVVRKTRKVVEVSAAPIFEGPLTRRRRRWRQGDSSPPLIKPSTAGVLQAVDEDREDDVLDAIDEVRIGRSGRDEPRGARGRRA